ncbi:MAG: molybdopterin-dependent oxidoreductase [Planctomycetota bacterium]
MPTVTINGVECEFEQGERVLDIATRCGVEVPYYCYHPGLSIPAQCRICLAEMHAPNPRNGDKLEPIAGGKLLPTCTTPASDGMVVYANNPKAVANQKAVMEYLLINHPLDCPVCDQAGECHLQDYSFKYGRGTSRFEETKVKQAKKDLGPTMYIYSDRCIMCTRCVRFGEEVAGTGELKVMGRGNRSEIDVFPGRPLANELSGNVADICPVGALLDKDFLFTQRVWFLKNTPSIDGITASGDNILIEHNQGKIYRVKPRENQAVNKWWITDEVRYGWKHVHENRLSSAMSKRFGILERCTWGKAYDDAVEGVRGAVETKGRGLLLVVSPMLPCEEAYGLATLAKELAAGAGASVTFAVGYVPFRGEDKAFPAGKSFDDPDAFRMYAEKAPNAGGVRRVLESVSDSPVIEHGEAVEKLGAGAFAATIVTGNYPGEWAEQELLSAMDGTFNVVLETHDRNVLTKADVVLPGATWAEKAGTFENARGMLQAFEAAVPLSEGCRSEGQIVNDLLSTLRGEPSSSAEAFAARAMMVRVDEGHGQVPDAREVETPRSKLYNAADVRRQMAERSPELGVFATDVVVPKTETVRKTDMELVQL